MQFIYPEFLFALSVLAIPIIIHLFNFRRFKKIYFTNVRFLKEIKQDTQSKSKLKHLLVLLSRLLALTFLVLAFAQPFIPAKTNKVQTGTKRVSIYVDNSFSMDALGKNGSLLETAKKKAREIANAYKPSDEFQLLTSSFEGRHQRLVNRDEFIRILDEIKPTSSVHSISEILQRQQDALFSEGKSKTSKTAYIISDFQQSTFNLESAKIDSALQVSLVPVAASALNNLFIDTCYLATPFVQLNTPNELVVKIRNTGGTDVENIPLKLMINNSQKAIASISVNSNSSIETKLSFTISAGGWQRAQLNITDYPITFDDNFFFNFNVRNNLQVLCINGDQPSPALNAIFGNDPYFSLKNSNHNQVDYSAFSSMQLIILNEVNDYSSGLIQELKKFVTKGGSVFVIPSTNANISNYNNLFSELEINSFGTKVQQQEKVDKIEVRHPLFTGVFEKGKSLPENMDLPIVNSYYSVLRNSKTISETVMKLSGGNTYLSSNQSGRGVVYVLASSLQPEDGNFSRHALFVPVLLRAALRGSSEINKPLIIGEDHDFGISDTLISADNVFHLINTKEKFDIIPESKIYNNATILSVHDQIKNAENYDLNAGNALVAVESFNFNRKESDLSVYSPSELTEISSKYGNSKINVIETEGKDLSHSIAQLNEGKRLWKYCIILVLVFLAIEILLIRFFRK
ncbi:MAG: BatA and WFA domain-containing protein [Bacteroidetes bacterium]|nr:BatA and WFA domain-containing protein [Bacteroidota bacterium]MBK9412689.1 BatA and WFA domain-containing protein [Bacteroidota bacterium]